MTIHYVSIIVLFVESLLVLRNWSNRLHSYLFLSCVATLVNNIGYLLELKSKSQATYIAAVQMSYFGRVWITFALFMFAARLCRIGIPRFVTDFLPFVHAAVYLCVLTFPYHQLYYKNYKWTRGDIFPVFIHENGIVHNLFMAMTVVYIIFGMTWLFIACRKEKNIKMRNRLLAVLAAVTTESVFFVLQLIGYIGITKIYDVSIIGNTFGNVILFVAIFKYDLLGTTDIAREMMIDRIAEGIIAVDNAGIIRYYNEHARELYPQIVEEGASLPDAITEAEETGDVIRIGDRKYSTESNELIHKGERLGKLYALIDDTEHFRYMEMLEHQKEMADSASEAKSRFLANMSHEIRTPINAVMGMNEMILRKSLKARDEMGEDQEELRETFSDISNYSGNIDNAGKNLLSIINDILDFSKIEAGKMEIITGKYRLSSLLNDVSNMIYYRAKSKDLSFVVEVDEDLPDGLCGDEAHIRQAVINILNNAVKYTHEGGVRLRVSGRTQHDSMSNTDYIRLTFEVKDTGIGIRKQDLEKLFAKFERVDLEHNKSVEGTGLGLAITRNLIEMMGGEVSVESLYGSGSTFTIRIPQEVVSHEPVGDFRQKFEESMEKIKAYEGSFEAPEARILIVDDTKVNLLVAEGLLKETKMRIDTASSGADAVRLANGTTYDVIMMDQRMPKVDGSQALQMIREQKDGFNKTTPVICLTADAVMGAKERYLAEGFTDYLTKPIDSKAMEKMLIKYLPEEKVTLTVTQK